MLKTLSFLAGVISVSADVVHLTESTFSQYVGGDKHAIVEFYAPWCGHCKNLAPEWATAGATFDESDGIVIADVDATENQALAQKFGVQGYPTIKYFPKGSTDAEEFEGGRSADTIVKWVNEKIGTNKKVKKAPTSVTVLEAADFDSVVMDPSKHVMVEFYAPWCGHCKNLAPVYEKLASAFKGEEDVVIANMDATDGDNGEIASRYGVTGYPTLKFFGAGASEPMDYTQGRDLESLVGFVNEVAGTYRLPNGDLHPTAGTVVALDEMVAEASEYGEAFATAIEKAASELDHPSANTYVNFAKKIAAKGVEYIETEIKRLQGMLSSKSIKPEKRKSFFLRLNILKKFRKSDE